MKLIFYKTLVSPNTVPCLNWFYAKKNQSSEFIVPTGMDYNNFEKWSLDFDRPLSIAEVEHHLVIAYYLGREFTWSMRHKTYFYDPIHGYCDCGVLSNTLMNQSFNYLNQLRLKTDFYPRKDMIGMSCQCYDNTWYAGKNILTVSDQERNAASKKYSSFKEGFRHVIYVKELDFYNVGSRTHYLVCSLNLMNVKQVQPGVFEVGLDYELIQNSYLYSQLYDIRNRIYPNVKSYFSDMSKLINSLFDNDQIIYYEKCLGTINYWLTHNFLPSNELYIYVFNALRSDPEKEFNEFDRFYIKRSDFDSILESKKQEKKINKKKN